MLLTYFSFGSLFIQHSVSIVRTLDSKGVLSKNLTYVRLPQLKICLIIGFTLSGKSKESRFSIETYPQNHITVQFVYLFILVDDKICKVDKTRTSMFVQCCSNENQQDYLYEAK